MSTFTFTTTEYDGPEQTEVVTMTGRSDFWTEQTDLFFRFLLAQGFLVSESDLAEFFSDKAYEIGALRANDTEPENAKGCGCCTSSDDNDNECGC
jgi:hypothetical protein